MVTFFINGGVAACKVVAFHPFMYCWFQLMTIFVYGFAASAGGRDSSWTSSGISFLMINLGWVTKSTNILAFCGGGPVLIFATDFSLILKLVGISRGGGTVISCSL